MVKSRLRFKLERRPYRLRNQIQHYSWGTRGDQAFIPQLIGLATDPELSYAELWMGTHSNAPSMVELEDSVLPLSALIQTAPEKVLGVKVARSFEDKLPFLFKLLSANEPLSIQTHPTKSQAVALHRRMSEHYPDDNHKPEIAIAIDGLAALVGFRTLNEIQETIDSYPEICELAGKPAANLLSNGNRPQLPLNSFFGAMMKNSIRYPENLSLTLDRIARSLGNRTQSLKEEEQLFLDLKDRYGSDVGLLSVLLLNLVHLDPGEALFIPAGIPHAYLSGNIVECMANSDNVVRAGLTPKFKDVETLIDILDYNCGSYPVLRPEGNETFTRYSTPAVEFQVSRFQLPCGQEVSCTSQDSLQLLLVLEGCVQFRWSLRGSHMSTALQRGDSWFIPAFLQDCSLIADTPSLLYKVDVP